MKIIVDVTNKCNLKCKHCGNLLKACEDCDFVEILKKIPYRINEIDILGGEPFMYSKLFDFIDYLEKNRIFFNLITNGQFALDVYKKICKYNYLKNISFSFDGDEEDNDYIRSKGCYRKSFNNALWLIENKNHYDLKYKIGVNITINKLNFNSFSLDRFLCFDYIYVNEMLPEGRAIENDVCISHNDYLDVIENICKKYKNLIGDRIIFDNSNPKFVDYLNIKYDLSIPFDFNKCGAGKEKIFISNEGKIYPCRGIKNEMFLSNNEIVKYAILIEKQIEKDNKYCDDCEFKENCFECPIKKRTRYIECKEIDNRLITYLDSKKNKRFKVYNEVLMYDVNENFCFFNTNSSTSAFIPIDYKYLFENEIIETEDYSELLMLLNLRNEGIIYECS